ncbi:MAG: ABC transporter ATP-binding protein [Acidobacteriota bacterium]
MKLPAVDTFNLSKNFGSVKAVSSLNLKVAQGEIFGLVGPDGAGKTTIIKMLSGVMSPSEGNVKILGFDLIKEKNKVKPYIGYLSQQFTLYGDLTVDENLDFFAEIYETKNFKTKKDELLKFTRLTDFRKRLAEKLSGGMYKKLALACSLVHDPKIVFLDGPTTGVDVLSRRELWKIFDRLLKEGITIFISTPYLDEAEKFSRVALINEGKLIALDSPYEIKKKFPFSILEVNASPIRDAYLLLKKFPNILKVYIFGNSIHIEIDRLKINQEKIKSFLFENKIEVSEIREILPSLEDTFISLLSN